ncbi:MAG: hypothetical protein K1X35_06025 [Caulobacteraceae bacterium]|nr:hypothetical protein [Caulobacteraceae bacterium]
MNLKPHQIGIIVVLILVAGITAVWISGGLAGLAINGQKPDTEAIEQ